MAQCRYEALSCLWSGVQEWGTGKYLLSAMRDLYKTDIYVLDLRLILGQGR
jgi:hypothetical protein